LGQDPNLAENLAERILIPINKGVSEIKNRRKAASNPSLSARESRS